MANRGFSAAMLTEIAKGTTRHAYLIELYFPSSTDYYTTANSELTWNSTTYLSSGTILDISSVEETLGMTINDAKVTLTGVALANIAQALSVDSINKRIVIRHALLSAANVVIVDPLVEFDGRIDTWSATEDISSETSTITYSASSHWSDFDAVVGRVTSDENQRLLFPTDGSMQYVRALGTQQLKWGSV